MTHLTANQILQTVDGTADYATQAAVTNHLAVCLACRHEMEFQRSLLRNARRAPLPEVSESFTRRVMAQIIPRVETPLSAWILNNMGNVFAMMAVLGVIWLVLSQPISFAGGPDTSKGARVVEEWQQGLSKGYAWVEHTLRTMALSTGAETRGGTNKKGGERLVLVLLSLGALWTLDRFWLSRHRAWSRQ